MGIAGELRRVVVVEAVEAVEVVEADDVAAAAAAYAAIAAALPGAGAGASLGRMGAVVEEASFGAVVLMMGDFGVSCGAAAAETGDFGASCGRTDIMRALISSAFSAVGVCEAPDSVAICDLQLFRTNQK